MGKKKASKRRKARERAAAVERQRQEKTAANLKSAETTKANLDAEFGSRSTTAKTGDIKDAGKVKEFGNRGGGKKKRGGLLGKSGVYEKSGGARKYDFSVMGNSPVLKRNLMSDMNPNNRNVRRTRRNLGYEPGAASIGDTGNSSETPMNSFGLDRRNLTNQTQVGMSGNAAPSTTDQNQYTSAATMNDDTEEKVNDARMDMARAAATTMIGI
jgi:hypothetical protein